MDLRSQDCVSFDDVAQISFVLRAHLHVTGSPTVKYGGLRGLATQHRTLSLLWSTLSFHTAHLPCLPLVRVRA